MSSSRNSQQPHAPSRTAPIQRQSSSSVKSPVHWMISRNFETVEQFPGVHSFCASKFRLLKVCTPGNCSTVSKFLLIVFALCIFVLYVPIAHEKCTDPITLDVNVWPGETKLWQKGEDCLRLSAKTSQPCTMAKKTRPRACLKRFEDC